MSFRSGKLFFSVVAAGRVWRMSPIALSRMSRIARLEFMSSVRSGSMLPPENKSHEFGRPCSLAFGIFEDVDICISRDGRSPALRGGDRHQVDGPQRGNERGACACVEQRTFAFQNHRDNLT